MGKATIGKCWPAARSLSRIVAIAILLAHAALDLTERVTYSRGICRSLRLISGTIAMGTGIWSMHYIGLLAFQLPVMVKYDWPTVLLSLLAAILASGCALYCEIMGGKVWIGRKPSVGSHFPFTIGVERSKTKLSKAVLAPVGLAGVRVLVIDDNRTNRRILDGLLRSWGMEPTVVSGAEEALAVLAGATRPEHSFRLIVTDRHMPRMDGFGLIEALRQVGASPTSTIMMLSSAGQGVDAARCQESGIAAYPLKPVREWNYARPL